MVKQGKNWTVNKLSSAYLKILFLLFLSSDASICSTMALPPLGNSDHVVVSVSIDFIFRKSNSPQHAPCHCTAYDYSRADWDGHRDHLRDVPWADIFKLSSSAAASGFCESVQAGVDGNSPHRKYQVKPDSPPWFLAACAAAIVHRNHFFRLYQQNKPSESKVKFRQARNRCKRVPEVPNLHILIIQKSPSLLKNLALETFGELPIVSSEKVNLLYLLYLKARRCCLLHLIKQNCLLKTFLRTLLLMTQVSLYLFSLLELI